MNGFTIPLLPPAWESPSKLEHGIAPWDENQIRYKGSMLIDNLVNRLGDVNYTMVTGTAHYYFQAFYNHKSLMAEDIGLVGLAVVFLACKVTEFPRKMRDLTRAYQQEIALSYPGLEFMEREQFELRECVTRIEGFLLRVISFNFRPPVDGLVDVLKDMATPIRLVFGKLMPDAQAELLHTHLVNTARSFLQDSFRGLCPHKFPPPLLVSGCLLLAYSFKRSEWVQAVPALNMSWTALFPTLPSENDLKGVKAEFISLFRVRKNLPEKIVFTLPDQTPREQPTAPQGHHRKRPRGVPSPSASVSPGAPPPCQQSYSHDDGPHSNSAASRQAPYPTTSSAPAPRHNPEAGVHHDVSAPRHVPHPNASNAHPLRRNSEAAAHSHASTPRHVPHSNASGARPLRQNLEATAHSHASTPRRVPHPNVSSARPLRQNPEAAPCSHASTSRHGPHPNAGNAHRQTVAHPHTGAHSHTSTPRHVPHFNASTVRPVCQIPEASAHSHSSAPWPAPHPTTHNAAGSGYDPGASAPRHEPYLDARTALPPPRHTPRTTAHAHAGALPHHAGAYARAPDAIRSAQCALDHRGGVPSASSSSTGRCHNVEGPARAVSSTDDVCGSRVVKRPRCDVAAEATCQDNRTSTATATSGASALTVIGSGGRDSRSTGGARGSGGRESESTITIGSGSRDSGSSSTVRSVSRRSRSTITANSGGSDRRRSKGGSGSRRSGSTITVGSGGPDGTNMDVSTNVCAGEGLAGVEDGRTSPVYDGCVQIIEHSVPDRHGALVPSTASASLTGTQHPCPQDGVTFRHVDGCYAYGTDAAPSTSRSPVYDDAQRAYAQSSLAFE